MTEDASSAEGDIDLESDTSIQHFECTVQSLASLRDEGKYIVVFGRRGAVRFVGNIQDIQRSLSERMQREVGKRGASKSLMEVKRFSGAASSFESVDAAARFLESHIYEEEFNGLDEQGKQSLRETLKKKLELSRSLLPPAFKERRRRLRTATDACLEELDVEVVSERRDDYRSISVDQPFLRLRIRYSDGSGVEGFPWFIGGGFWSDEPDLPCKTFSIECDETDIDVLLFRLREAKKRLASAVTDSMSHNS